MSPSEYQKRVERVVEGLFYPRLSEAVRQDIIWLIVDLMKSLDLIAIQAGKPSHDPS